VERELAFVAWSPENRVSLCGIGGLIYTIKAKAMSGVTLLVLILPSHKTPNYPPMLLTSQKKLRIFFFHRSHPTHPFGPTIMRAKPKK
jgi:hypothetical protein